MSLQFRYNRTQGSVYLLFCSDMLPEFINKS